MKGISWGTLVTFTSVALVILFWQNNILLTAILIVLTFVMLRFLWNDKKDALVLFVGALVGAITEAVCVYFGVWTYNNPTLLIPLWLPFIWGFAALMIRRYTIYLEKKR